jgi:hypothetical protein
LRPRLSSGFAKWNDSKTKLALSKRQQTPTNVRQTATNGSVI